MTVRVLLADDQALFREAVAAMLARDARLEIVASVSSGDEAISFVRAHAVDVILMDIRMPEQTASPRPGKSCGCVPASAFSF